MSKPTVYLFENNPATRDTIAKMLMLEGIRVIECSCAKDLLESYDSTTASCLVSEYCQPEFSGIRIRKWLKERGCHLPYLLMTRDGEIRDATTAIRQGALDFLEKPVQRELFLQRIYEAFEKDQKRILFQSNRHIVQQRLDSLTDRQREVLDLVVLGMLTKQIANKLGVSIKTVEVHRSNITKKMQVKSVIHLVRLMLEHRSADDDATFFPYRESA